MSSASFCCLLFASLLRCFATKLSLQRSTRSAQLRTLDLHGGLGPRYLGRDITQINDFIRAELRGERNLASGVGTDPEGPLTARPFGAAIVLNPATNKPGDPPEQSSELVQAMARSGFGWAGTDAFPQGALFRFRGRTSIQD